MKANSDRNLIVLSLLAFCILLTAVLLFAADRANASAPSGLPATVATSSTPTVTTTTSLVFATTSNCAARVISTASSSIMTTFSDFQGDAPNAAKGFWQAASTTKEYDAGLYGCGAFKIYSFATQQITVLESR